MLYAVIIAVVLLLAVALRIWAGEEPDNAIVHHQENEPRDSEDDAPDLMAGAAREPFER
jgi:hypothetical protein